VKHLNDNRSHAAAELFEKLDDLQPLRERHTAAEGSAKAHAFRRLVDSLRCLEIEFTAV
jgi:hypothetical protein